MSEERAERAGQSTRAQSGASSVPAPRYLLRPNVQVARTDEGLGFWGWESSFVIKGPAALSKLWQGMLPDLQQGITRPELFGKLPANTHPVVERILAELTEHNMLLDSSRLTAPVIEDGQAGQYLDTLRYLQSLSPDPYAAFTRIRSARVVVAGSGLAIWPACRLLARAGVGEVVAAMAGPADRPADLTGVTACPLDSGADLLEQLRVATTHAVVQLEVDPETPRISEVGKAASSAGVPLVCGVVLDERAVIGPIGSPDGAQPGTPEALAALRRRTGRALRPGADTSPVLAALAGNLASYTALQLLAQLPSQLTAGSALVAERAMLATSEHPVTIVAPSQRPLAEALAAFTAAATPDSRSAVLAGLEPLTDQYFGVLARLGPEELSQVPVPLALAELPAAGREPARVLVAPGLDGADARLRALVAALRVLLVSIDGEPAKHEVLALGSGRLREVATGQLVVAAGHDYAGWVADGLLLLAARGALPAGPEQPVEAGDLTTERAVWWARTLGVRYGADLRLVVAQVADLPAWVARASDGDRLLAVAAAPQPAAALEEALLQAVGLVQAGEAGYHLPVPHSTEQPEPVLTLRNQQPPAPPDRQQWLEQAIGSLRQRGYEVVARPFTGQPAAHQAGLLLGRVGVVDAG